MPVAVDAEPELVRDRTVTGVLLALLGHALTLVPLALSFFLDFLGPGDPPWLFAAFPAGQLILPVACLGTALVLRGRDPGRLGRALVLGWFGGLGCAWLIAVGMLCCALMLATGHR
jgi:hypothetical protein